jgi:CheY-like chemotaxis protein
MTTEPKGRILVIDDDQAVRSAYERLLSHAGYDVRAASSPYEGLESVGDWKPDVILLDLAMPTISGFEGAKVFKKKPATRDAILVAFSGMISDDEVTRFRRIGFDEVLPKPVAAIMIVERIESFLARRAASRQDV